MNQLLPSELIHHTANFLFPNDIASASLTCKSLHSFRKALLFDQLSQNVKNILNKEGSDQDLPALLLLNIIHLPYDRAFIRNELTINITATIHSGRVLELVKKYSPFIEKIDLNCILSSDVKKIISHLTEAYPTLTIIYDSPAESSYGTFQDGINKIFQQYVQNYRTPIFTPDLSKIYRRTNIASKIKKLQSYLKPMNVEFSKIPPLMHLLGSTTIQDSTRDIFGNKQIVVWNGKDCSVVDARVRDRPIQIILTSFDQKLMSIIDPSELSFIPYPISDASQSSRFTQLTRK